MFMCNDKHVMLALCALQWEKLMAIIYGENGWMKILVKKGG